MRTRLKGALSLSACLLFVLGFSISATAERKLDLSQLPASLQETLKKILSQNQKSIEGQKLSFTKPGLDQLLKVLISEYGYDFAEIQVEHVDNDEIYHLIVMKNGKILNITFSGIRSFSETVLRQELGVSEKSRFDQNLLVEGAERIRQFYVYHGFPKTVVDLEIQRPNGIDATVHIKIHEGVQTKISDIKIISRNHEFNKLSEKFLKSRVGKVFTDVSLAEIRNESRNFFSKKGYLKAELQDPKLIFTEDESKVSLEFKIERPEKYEIQISGYKKTNRLDIDRAIDIDHFFSVSPSIGSELATKIRSFYLSEGFARVEVSTEELDSDKIYEKIIRFSISEGPQVEVADFKIIGNYSQPQQYYIDFIKNHSSELILSGYYNRDDMDLGLKNVIIDRQNQGYLKARIVSTRAIYNEQKDKITFLINFEEGPLTILEEIRFEGLVAFQSKQLLPLIGLPLPNLQTESALKLNQLEESVSKLREFYRNQGFLEMTLLNEKQDLVSYNEDNTKAKVLYRVYEGPKIVVASIVIEGNSLTKDKVVLKELDFKQGDTLTPQKLEESIGRLQKLGHFSSIQIKTLEEKTQISNRTVVVKVTDRDPGLFNFGFGLNNERTLTLRGYTGIAYRNIRGSGRGVSGRVDANYNVADVKYLENKMTLGYLEPYLFDSRMRGRISQTRSRQVSDFEKEIISEVNQTTWTVEEDITSHILLSYDLYSLATVKEFQRYGIEEIFPTSNQNIGTMGPTLDLDFRDHPFNPTKGSFTRFNIEYSAPWLGSNATIEYVKYYTSFSHYYPISKSGWILANNIRAGYLKNLSFDGAVPYEKKGFSLGGQSTIRGFESPESFPGEFELGTARYRLTTNATMYLIKSELRFPIMDNIGGALFYDGGAVLIDTVDISDPYRDAVGVAFRYTTPVGAVSLDWGFKLDQKSDRSERPIAFHFSIGTF